MQDVNGNGLPDDEWYELRGSETGKPTTIQDYEVTYFRPASDGSHTYWIDNLGNTGWVDFNAYHTQPYYYPLWITADSTLCTVLDYCHAIHKVHPQVTGVTLLMTGGMWIIAVPICWLVIRMTVLDRKTDSKYLMPCITTALR